jgi:hypothetical protein
MALATSIATATERHRSPADTGARIERWRRPLLASGILAAVLYVAMTLLVGLLWDGYSAADQTISELSAVGAPTRPMWMLLGTTYSALMIDVRSRFRTSHVVMCGPRSKPPLMLLHGYMATSTM